MPTKLQKEYYQLWREIKAAAKAQGKKLTQEQIAKELGYNRSYLSQLLNGGSVTKDHVKKMRLYFKDVLQPPEYKDKYIKSLEEQVEQLKKMVGKRQ